MALFRKAGESFIGGKFMVYGQTGSGKSKFTLTFPKIGAIDTEAGLSNYEGHPNLIFVANTSSYKEVEEAVDEIEESLMKEIETFVVDSETKIYDNMQIVCLDVEEKRAKSKGGEIDDTNLSVRSWGRIKNLTKRLQSAKIDLSSKGIFIVSTAQSSDVTKQVGGERVVVGEKAESHKSLPFDYDVVLRFFVEEKIEKGKKTAHYTAEVLKDRTSTFNKFDIIDNPSFEMWKPYYDAKKKNGACIQTSYKQAVVKDEDAIVEEDKTIDESKSKLKEIIALGDEHKKQVVAIYREVGIKNAGEITTNKLALRVMELAKAYLEENQIASEE